MGPDTTPAYWWWDTDLGTRALVLTDTQLGISDHLDRIQLAGLEDARRRGAPLDADLGGHGLVIDVDDIVEMRLGRDESVVELLMVDGVTSVGLRPPDWSIAAGLFEELRRRRAPSATVRATMVNPAPESEPTWWSQVATTSLMAATGGLGALFCVFASMEPEAATGDPGRDGVRSVLHAVFATVGFVPALLCFVVTLLLAVARLMAGRTALRRIGDIRHEVRVAVPAPTPAPVSPPESPPDALLFDVPTDGADPLSDLLADPSRA